MKQWLTLAALCGGPGSMCLAEQVVFSEVMYHPAESVPEFIEVWNITRTPLDMAKWEFTGGISYSFPDFAPGSPQAHILQGQERIVVSALGEAATRGAYPSIPANVRVFGPWTGNLDSAGETISLSDKNGVVLCKLDYRDGGNWPKAADGAGHSLVLRNENNPIDDFRNWRASRFTGGTPGSTEFTAVEAFAGNAEVGVGASATIFDYGAAWKWNVPAGDPGGEWRGTVFDDSGWGSGSGLFGFENAGLPSPGLQTAVGGTGASMVYLFRKTFNFAGSPAGATFTMDQVVDDGVSYYLNGHYLGSVGHSPAAWNGSANRTVPDATEELAVLTGPATGLVNGTNLLAAEVHQVNGTSTDMVFGARLMLGTQSSLVINEVKPGSAGQGFVEFYNTTGAAIDLQNHYLSDDPANLTKFQIASSLSVPAGGYATLGFAESNLAVGATTTVYLTETDGTTGLNAVSAAIPMDGRSLGRNPAGGASWFLFAFPTAGSANGSIGEAGFSLRLSEVHFGANGGIDWVELENTAPSAATTAGLFLSSKPDFSDKLALGGSVPGSGQASWECAFATDSSGEVVLYLTDAGNTVLGLAELTRVAGRPSLQAVYPPAVAVKPSWQNVPEQPWWNSFPTDTRDAANSVPLEIGVVINEIMPDPPSDHQNGQFLELHNHGASPVALTGWKLRGGAEFDFATGTSIPAGGYLVVGRDVAFLQAVYPQATVVGPWSGGLSDGGSLVRLIDAFGNLADEVDYEVGGDWPTLAGGDGSSLELVNHAMDRRRPSAWRSSAEDEKMPWQTYTITGAWSQLSTLGGVTDYKELHLFLVGDSHLALRNFSLTPSGGGANLLPNAGAALSTDGTSVSGWLCQGTHAASFLQGSELHLVADGHGDNRPNRAEIDVIGMTSGQSYTLTFEARWIYGKNRLVVQTWDHSFGGEMLLPMPAGGGTAGAINSRYVASAPPQVDSMLHQPAVPRSADAVKVTARVTSVLPLSAVEVVHRTDSLTNDNPAYPWMAAPMFDDGSNGDAVAKDGLYTATITSHQVNGQIVQFYVRATAAGGATHELPTGGAARPGLWIVDNRSLDNRLRRQRFVISEYERDIFNSSGDTPSAKFDYKYPRLSNHYAPCTFIHNETDVYYNSEIRKSGSPWTRSSGWDLSRGKWKVARDRLFRGREKSTFDNDAEGGNRHHNRITRYWLYVLGHPANENEFVYNVINSDGLTIREDTEPVDGEEVARIYPGGGKGQLYRSDDEWWFGDSWNRNQRNADWSYKGTDRTLRYHTEWMLRSREAEYDYGALIEFFRTVSNSPNYSAVQYRELVNRMLDPDLTLMMAAVRGYIEDWDSLTLSRGKNGFFYRKPTDGRFMFLHWDSDLAFGNSSAAVVGSLAGWGTYINTPWARRIFNYYLSEMLRLTSGSNSVRTRAWLEAEENSSPAYSVNKAFYESWFANRRGAVEVEINRAVGGGPGNAYDAAFGVTTASGTTAAATLNLSGTAPSTAYGVVVAGHPEAVFAWTNQTVWTISGLTLQEGVNTFSLQMHDGQGAVLGEPLSYTYIKTGNAAPVMMLAASPESFHVGLGEPLELEATGSFDPEGTALTFAWTIPGSGVAITAASPSVRSIVFTVPGTYSITVTGTDAAAQVGSVTREVAVFNAEDFDSFNEELLPSLWSLQAVDVRGAFSPSSWYSLEDNASHLLVQVRDDSPKPLAYSLATFPAFYRPLPASADFALQTKLAFESKRTGSAFAGLAVEVLEEGTRVKYAFGVEGGLTWRVKRSTGGSFANVGPSSVYTGLAATLRVRRIDTVLLFEQRLDGLWVPVHAETLPAGSTMVRGGPFVATSAAENTRISFDYVLLADPTNANSQLNNLRITELMYSPKVPDMVEFVEIMNVGTGTIDLAGCRFPQGDPFDEFVFPSLSLETGQYVVVTNNTSAFQDRYGEAPLLAGAWPGGALNNVGEQVVLLDSDGNPIHQFAFSNLAPWPTTPDGQGPSLEVIDTNGDYTSPTNWRASFELGGSPGRPGSTGPSPDSDGDGMSDSAEALFGTNPSDPNSMARLAYLASGELSFPSVPGHQYRFEGSETLNGGSWVTLQLVTATGTTTSLTDPTTPLPLQQFYRVTAVLP